MFLFIWMLGVRHSTYRDARGVAHSYFFSWEHGPTSSLEVDWLDARNICRRHCMDAVSLETPQVMQFHAYHNYIFTMPHASCYSNGYNHYFDIFVYRKMNSLNKG